MVEKIPEEIVKKDIESIRNSEYFEYGESVIGENRDQLFVRIPRFFKERLKLEKGMKAKFEVKIVKGKAEYKITFDNEKNR